MWAVEEYPSLIKVRMDVPYRSLEVRSWLNRLPPHMHDLFMALIIVRPILRLFRRFRFDIIYVNVGDLRNALPAYFVSRIVRRPMILIFHGMALRDRMGFRDLLSSRRMNKFGLAAAIFYTFLDLVRWIIYQKAEVCFAVSESAAREVARRFNLDRLYVTGNGAGTLPEGFADFADLMVHKRYDAAYCGSLEPAKGTDTPLQIWRSVTSQLKSARLLVIGEGVRGSTNGYKKLGRCGTGLFTTISGSA